MIPANVHPFLLCGDRDPLDEFGIIEKSLRFRASANARLQRTFGTPTSSSIWTLSLWVKRAALTGTLRLFGAGTNTYLTFNSSDQLNLTLNGGSACTSGAVFRDPGAWEHLVYVQNGSSQSIYWGNLLVASGTTAASIFNTAIAHQLGAANTANFFDGYLAHVCFVDGQALTPDAFARVHPRTGQWRPITKAAIRANVSVGGGARNGWGNNGFFLPFDDTASLTTLGYDRSQSDSDTGGNNWTATNISLTAGTTYDSMLDTPTNNYAVLNPLQNSSLTNGNLHFLDYGVTAISTVAIGSGKVWSEVCHTTMSITGGTTSIGILRKYSGVNDGTWANADAVLYRADGQKFVLGALSAYGATYAANDVIGVLVDFDSNTVEFFKQTNGAGNFVSQGVINVTVNQDSWRILSYSSGAVGNGGWANFGQRPFNYVLQHGSLPTGSTGWSTKSLPIIPSSAGMDPTKGFQTTLATEANIYAEVATARDGWSAYVDILKNRDAVETWAWQFSHDSANEYAIAASSVVRQAKRAMSGSQNWVGYSIRIGQQFGTAAGSVTHTNGVNTTVPHNLGITTRQMIFLFPRAGGTSVKVYHPDLTAGNLLNLCSNASQAADTSLSNVTSTSFRIASTMATGTYDYLVLSELDGFLALGKYAANGSTNGPFDDYHELPEFFCVKLISGVSTGDWRVSDASRNANNMATARIWLSQNLAEDSAASVDLVSNGVKIRDGSSVNDANYPGSVYITFAFAKFPFRYANAR